MPSPATVEELGDTRRVPARRGRRALGYLAVALASVIVLVAGLGVYTLARFESRVFVARPPTPTTPASAAGALNRTTGAAGLATAAPSPTAVLASLPPGRLNILVLGTDKRPSDPDHWPRSDTLIIANVDPSAKEVRLLSIPRDLVAEVPGYGRNKINSAYMLGEYYREPGGGQALAARAVSDLFGVPIDYYAAINFEGFRQLVDTVGGVTIDVPYEIDDFHYPSDDEGDPFGEIHVHFDAGLQHMDGKQALRYARTRHADNDFMRSRRQLQIILGVRQAALRLDLLPRLPSIVDQLGGMLETDVPFDKQLAFGRLGYELGASSIITAAIDSTMIVPVLLPDGSEGLRLDWNAAGHMLDEFFGRDVASDASVGSAQDKVGTPEGSEQSGSSQLKTRKTTTPTAGPPRRRATPTSGP